MPSRGKLLIGITALAFVQSLLRLLFFYVGTYEGAQLISPSPSPSTMEFINLFSLGLGILGLLVIPGLLLFRNWGYWGTIALCTLTIGFDGWAVATTAWTAAAGLVIPVLLAAYLVSKENRFLHPISAGRS